MRLCGAILTKRNISCESTHTRVLTSYIKGHLFQTGEYQTELDISPADWLKSADDSKYYSGFSKKCRGIFRKAKVTEIRHIIQSILTTIYCYCRKSLEVGMEMVSKFIGIFVSSFMLIGGLSQGVYGNSNSVSAGNATRNCSLNQEHKSSKNTAFAGSKLNQGYCENIIRRGSAVSYLLTANFACWRYFEGKYQAACFLLTEALAVGGITEAIPSSRACDFIIAPEGRSQGCFYIRSLNHSYQNQGNLRVLDATSNGRTVQLLRGTSHGTIWNIRRTAANGYILHSMNENYRDPYYYLDAESNGETVKIQSGISHGIYWDILGGVGHRREVQFRSRNNNHDHYLDGASDGSTVQLVSGPSHGTFWRLIRAGDCPYGRTP